MWLLRAREIDKRKQLMGKSGPIIVERTAAAATLQKVASDNVRLLQTEHGLSTTSDFTGPGISSGGESSVRGADPFLRGSKGIAVGRTTAPAAPGPSTLGTPCSPLLTRTRNSVHQREQVKQERSNMSNVLPEDRSVHGQEGDPGPSLRDGRAPGDASQPGNRGRRSMMVDVPSQLFSSTSTSALNYSTTHAILSMNMNSASSGGPSGLPVPRLSGTPRIGAAWVAGPSSVGTSTFGFAMVSKASSGISQAQQKLSATQSLAGSHPGAAGESRESVGSLVRSSGSRLRLEAKASSRSTVPHPKPQQERRSFRSLIDRLFGQSSRRRVAPLGA